MDEYTQANGQATNRVAYGMLGPIFMGCIAQLYFSGIFTSSAYKYFQDGHYSQDPKLVRRLTILVVFLNSFATIVSVVEIVHWGCSQNRSPADLYDEWYSDIILPIPVVLLGTIVQVFYCRRVVKLMQTRWARVSFLLCLGLCMTISVVAGILVFVDNVMYITNTVYLIEPFTFFNLTATWLMGSAACDVFISVTLCVLLKSRVAGFAQRTDTILNSLVKLAIETASYTATVSVIGAICSIVFANTSYYTLDTYYAFWIPLPAFYSIAFMTNLSAKDKLARTGAQLSLDSRKNGSFLPSPNPLGLGPSTAIGGHAPSFLNFKPSGPVHQDHATSLGTLGSTGGRGRPKLEHRHTTNTTTSSFFQIDVEVEVDEERGTENWEEEEKERRREKWQKRKASI